MLYKIISWYVYFTIHLINRILNMIATNKGVVLSVTS